AAFVTVHAGDHKDRTMSPSRGDRGALEYRLFIAWIGVMSMMGQVSAERAGGQASADWRVWTETETRHVLRDDPPGSGHTVRIAAARNEWESFQILVRSEVA